MKLANLIGLAGATIALSAASCQSGPPVRVAAAGCETPPVASCTLEGCSGVLAVRGNAVDPKTGREFFLDYPCDLKPGEKVTFVLNIHGAGSSGNWQRHYFPAKDYKEKYRLVVATPTAATANPTRMWTADADDQHLRNISELIFDQFGHKNIKAFWLAGHSQGGMTSNRIICTDYFKDRVDGWLSLSGGRIGRAEIAPDFFGSGGPPAALGGGGPNTPRPGAAQTPACDFSYIFTSGEMEIVSLPEKSPWAEKYGCAERARREDIVDTQKGYVTGARSGRPASWGREARPGTAQEFVYPKCKDGKLVADVIRLDKGHTEGLEPKVTEELVRLMTSAPGGKLARVS